MNATVETCSQQQPDWRFSAFGLNWCSSFPCPGTRPIATEETTDITVIVGNTPVSLGPDSIKTHRFESESGKLLLKTRTIANYYITDGERIVIDPCNGSTEWRIQNLLFGWATAGLLQQRGTLALHASAVAHNDSAIAFCGNSGVGKSTLVAQLAARDLSVLDDNLVVTEGSDQETRVHGGVGYIRLMEDCVQQLGLDKTQLGCISAIDPNAFKYVVPLYNNSDFPGPVVLRRIYILERGPSYRSQILTGHRKFEILRRFIFKREFLTDASHARHIYAQLLQVCSRVDIRELVIPIDKGPGYLADKVVCDIQTQL